MLLAAAGILHRPPQVIAAEIAARLALAGSFFSDAQADAGFVNFTLSSRWYDEVIADIHHEGALYGSCDIGKGRRAAVKLSRPNENAPMSAESARAAVVGDTLARVLSRAGYQVSPDFFVQDGSPAQLPGLSVKACDVRQRGEGSPDRLCASGSAADTIKSLYKGGHTCERDGAVWFRATNFGCEKDAVILGSDGLVTCFSIELADTRSKLIEGGYDRSVCVTDASRREYAQCVKAGMSALGIDPARLDFVFTQQVILTRDGQPVRLSETDTAFPLSRLLEEITPDTARFFFSLRQAQAPLEFDLDLALRQDGGNPAYFVQYVCARIGRLIKNLSAGETTVSAATNTDANAFTAPEKELIKLLAQYPEEIRLAARDLDPTRITRFLIRLATCFHRFYTGNRIYSSDEAALRGRLRLLGGVRAVLNNGLELMGIAQDET